MCISFFLFLPVSRLGLLKIVIIIFLILLSFCFLCYRLFCNCLRWKFFEFLLLIILLLFFLDISINTKQSLVIQFNRFACLIFNYFHFAACLIEILSCCLRNFIEIWFICPVTCNWIMFGNLLLWLHLRFLGLIFLLWAWEI